MDVVQQQGSADSLLLGCEKLWVLVLQDTCLSPVTHRKSVFDYYYPIFRILQEHNLCKKK